MSSLCSEEIFKTHTHPLHFYLYLSSCTILICHFVCCTIHFFPRYHRIFSSSSSLLLFQIIFMLLRFSTHMTQYLNLRGSFIYINEPSKCTRTHSERGKEIEKRSANERKSLRVIEGRLLRQWKPLKNKEKNCTHFGYKFIRQRSIILSF